jgi:hypothetical protein
MNKHLHEAYKKWLYSSKDADCENLLEDAFVAGARAVFAEQNFICGGGIEVDDDGMRKMILVCRFAGDDGMVVYEKKGKYSNPEY